jgi:hypothetical protein
LVFSLVVMKVDWKVDLKVEQKVLKTAENLVE